ncbi:MAG: hypothetical protein JSS20_11690, partial [Proteobacteria bacterium]|nr:hypothetical protein [Pseudomonadota bacterium]
MNGGTARSVRAAAARAIGSPLKSRGLIGECLAGVVASFVTLAYCLSFSALLFGGDLAAGLPMALWGFTIGAGLVTIMTGF